MQLRQSHKQIKHLTLMDAVLQRVRVREKQLLKAEKYEFHASNPNPLALTPPDP